MKSLYVNFHTSFCVIITFDRVCAKKNPVALISEVHVLISENSTETHIIMGQSFAICVVHGLPQLNVEGTRSRRSVWLLAVKRRSVTMETMAVTKDIE